MEVGFVAPLSFVLLFAFFCTYFGIWAFLNTPLVNLFIDKPGVRKIHQNYTPRAGGICIVITFLCTLFLWKSFFKLSLPILDNVMLYAILAITIGIFTIGFFDDFVLTVLKTKYKFFFEICISSTVVIFFQFYVTKILIMPGSFLSLGWLGIPVTVLWITGVTNSINTIDGIDGLAGTVVLISFIGVAILAGLADQFDIVILCVICIAQILGFLLHNMSSTRIFFGDTGSLFFGIILGLLTVHLVTLPNAHYSILVAPLLVGFPLLDIMSAMFRRFVKTFLAGKNLFHCIKAIFTADNEHIHHRLLYKGLDQQKIVFVVSIYSVTLVSSAVLISFISPKYVMIINSYLFIMTVWFMIKLHFMDRIFSAISNKELSIKNTKKVPIHVINADEILRHSLREFDQNIFSFKFQKKQDFLKNGGVHGAILFVNESSEDLRNDIDFILSKDINKNNHVVMTVNKGIYKNINLKRVPKNIEFLNRDSLYIPYLLDIIHTKAVSK